MEKGKPMGLLQPTSAGVLAREYKCLGMRMGGLGGAAIFFLKCLFDYMVFIERMFLKSEFHRC